MIRSIFCGIVACTALSFYPNFLLAGEIPGTITLEPPDLQGDFRFKFSNDFFGIANNQDDFRTQQTILSAKVSNDWLLIYDQSILTYRGPNPGLADPPGSEGRLDQQSLSLAYRIHYDQTPLTINQVYTGGGFRSYGDFGGAAIQNGAHRLFEDEIVTLPYIGTDRTDAVVWVQFSRQHYFSKPLISNWRHGYWLDGAALVTSDGQLDGHLAMLGVLRRHQWEVWTGPRVDWRNGYDRDIVQRATAEHERGVAWLVGIALGPVRLETSYGLGNNDNSYGSLMLSAEANTSSIHKITGSHWDYQFAILTPRIGVQNQVRWSPEKWVTANDTAYSLVVDYRYGTAARDSSGNSYNISNQFIIGAEARFAGQDKTAWVHPYIMLGAGYRSEYIDGQSMLVGQQSSRADSPTLVADAGLRFRMAGKQQRWQVDMVAGVTGWLPVDEKYVDFNGQATKILKADTSWFFGVSSSFSYD